MLNDHPAEKDPFLQRLAALTPVGNLARDKVLFEAGRRAGRREAQPWRIAAAVMFVCAVGLAGFGTRERERGGPMTKSIEPSTAVASVRQAESMPASRPVDPDEATVGEPSLAATNLQIRNAMLRWGVERFPSPSIAAVEFPSKRSASVGEPLLTLSDDGQDLLRRRIERQLGGFSL